MLNPEIRFGGGALKTEVLSQVDGATTLKALIVSLKWSYVKEVQPSKRIEVGLSFLEGE